MTLAGQLARSLERVIDRDGRTRLTPQAECWTPVGTPGIVEVRISISEARAGPKVMSTLSLHYDRRSFTRPRDLSTLQVLEIISLLVYAFWKGAPATGVRQAMQRICINWAKNVAGMLKCSYTENEEHRSAGVSMP